jgi:hypothetical protein
MKLFTYADQYDVSSKARVGLFIDKVKKGIDLKAAYDLTGQDRSPEVEKLFASILSLVSSPKGLKLLSQLQKFIENKVHNNPLLSVEKLLFPLHEKRILAPIPRPLSIRDFLAFELHVKKSMQGSLNFLFPRLGALNKTLGMIFSKSLLKPPRLWYEIPGYYKGNPSSVVGHEAEIIWPEFTSYLDYELEIGIYIQKKGSNIPIEQANDYIGGYTIYNDMSARDLQMQEMKLRLGPSKSKDFDTGNIMGPFLVTPDEIKDPYNLEMVARVNGQEWTRGNSRDMYYHFEHVIAYVSKNETLYPGDFFGSGTVGNGCGLEHGNHA